MPAFWRKAMQRPWMRNHPDRMPTDFSCTIPTLWHVDGFEVFRNQEFYAWSWSSVLSSPMVQGLDVMDTQFLLCAIPHAWIRSRAVKSRIHQIIAKFVAWNIQIMSRGVGPTRGFYGEEFKPKSIYDRLADQPLAGQWKALYFGWHGDTKARREAHAFCQHYNSTYMCDECFAVQNYPRAPKILLYQNFGPDAMHLMTRFGHKDYMKIFRVRSPWVLNVPGCSKESLFKDVQHVVFLGTGRDLVASIIIDLLEKGTLRRHLCPDFLVQREEEVLKHLNIDFTAWCREKKLCVASLKSFTLSNLNRLQKNTYPELGSHFKSEPVKVLIFYVADLTLRLQGEDVHSRVRASCAWSMAQFVHVLSKADVWLTESEALEAFELMMMYLQKYQWLANESKTEETYMWFIRPKTHYLQHIAYDLVSLRLNPTKLQCTHAESFLGRIKRVGTKCPGKNVCLRLAQRLFVHLAVRWHRRRKE